MKLKRLFISLLCGAVLGVICIVGGTARAGGFSGNEWYILGMWYNRVIIGLVIGLAGNLVLLKGPFNPYLRGALLGLLVSTAFYLTSGLRDTTAFLAGIFYGIIIEFVLLRIK